MINFFLSFFIPIKLIGNLLLLCRTVSQARWLQYCYVAYFVSICLLTSLEWLMVLDVDINMNPMMIFYWADSKLSKSIEVNWPPADLLWVITGLCANTWTIACSLQVARHFLCQQLRTGGLILVRNSEPLLVFNVDLTIERTKFKIREKYVTCFGKKFEAWTSRLKEIVKL